jgi:hypothetical protein
VFVALNARNITNFDFEPVSKTLNYIKYLAMGMGNEVAFPPLWLPPLHSLPTLYFPFPQIAKLLQKKEKEGCQLVIEIKFTIYLHVY